MSGEHYNADYDDGGEASRPKYALRRQGAIGRALKAIGALYGMFTIAELDEITAEARTRVRLGVKL